MNAFPSRKGSVHSKCIGDHEAYGIFYEILIFISARDQLVPLVDKYFTESRTIGGFQVYWRPQLSGFREESVLA
jgi:hypothetical protein